MILDVVIQNHLIGEVQSRQKNNASKEHLLEEQSDNGEDEVENTKDETCLVAQAPDEICLGINLEPDDWIKDSSLCIEVFGYDVLGVNVLVLKVNQGFIYGVSADVDMAYSSKSGNGLEFI
ncbi:hypothetical protein Tco_0174649 [Tanacetum coccineum]